jgi:hypothetical protein
MNDLPFDPFESTAKILKLDYDAVELSRFFEEHCFSQDQMSAVDQFLEYLHMPVAQSRVHGILEQARRSFRAPLPEC